MTRNHAGKVLVLLCSILICLGNLSAQVTGSQIASMIVVNMFGTPITESGVYASEFLGLHAKVEYRQGSIRDFGEGNTLFIQEEGPLESWFPTTRGNFIALANDSGYINIFEGTNLYSDVDIRNDIEFKLSIYDRGRKAWVNPAFFIKDIQDIYGPQITSLALEKGGVEYDFKDSKAVRKPYSQGSYSILTSILDERSKQSSSGLIRIKVVLDGISVLDSKFDIAVAGMEGLSFIGYQAPSSRALGRKSRLKAGEIKLLRGEHTLELFAYDFSGNEAAIRWSLRVE